MQTDLECVGKLLVYDLDHAGKLALLPLTGDVRGSISYPTDRVKTIRRLLLELIGTILSNVKLLVARWI